MEDWEGKYPVQFTRTASGTSSSGSLTCGPGSSSTGYVGNCPAEAITAVTAVLTDADGPTITELE